MGSIGWTVVNTTGPYNPEIIMTNILLIILTCGYMAVQSNATELEFDLDYDSSVPRLIFANYTSSLISVNSTILAYALLALAIAGVAAIALYYLYLEGSSASGSSYGYQYSHQRDDYYHYDARSAPEGINVMNVIQWISMLQEVYEKFDYNHLECQKKLICEVMKEPEYFGTVSQKMKSGFQLARYLEVLNMPDDFRELLDEYMDASERSEGQKQCEEFFQCPYSLKDSVKRNFSGNSL